MNRMSWRCTGRPSLQPPGQPYAGEGARARLVSALNMEEVLVRHPRMRVHPMYAWLPISR